MNDVLQLFTKPLMDFTMFDMLLMFSILVVFYLVATFVVRKLR